MPLTMRVDTTEYVSATVTVDHDISGAAVHVALPQAGVAPSVWYPAEIVSAQSTANRSFVTYRILLGPAGGATQLSVGVYDWTVRVTDNPGPEVPVRKAGTLTMVAT